MSRPIEFSIGEYYHVYNRGTDKRDVFVSPSDYERFLALLHVCNSMEPINIRLQGKQLRNILTEKTSKKLVDVGVYCLMPNHFHVLLRERTENGISQFMHKLSTGYTMYFNKKNNRTGSLFQGTFQARHIDTDPYLKYLFAYIHLNPVKLIQPKWKKDGIQNIELVEKFLHDFKHSSYHEYIKIDRPQKTILEKEAFPDYFENKENFKSMIKFWLEFSPDHTL